MKRKALLICLLVAMTFSLQAKVSYQPSLATSAGGTFTYKVTDMWRTSLSGKIELDPFAIQINNKHTISIPMYFSYVSRTPVFDGYCLNSHTDLGFGLSYRYTFNDVLSLRTIVDMNLREVLEVDGVIYAFGLTIEPWLNMNSKIAFTFPMKVGFTKGELSFSPSVSLTITPFGVAS